VQNSGVMAVNDKDASEKKRKSEECQKKREVDFRMKLEKSVLRPTEKSLDVIILQGNETATDIIQFHIRG
jgi:hypothetical protein